MITRGTTDRKIGTILIINADPDITRILEINLSHANFEVLTANDGFSAINTLNRTKSDVIILDTALPDMDLNEVCRRIKDLTGEVPIILTGNNAKRKISIIKQENFILSYISKPFEPREVVALVKGYLIHKERAENIDPVTGLPNRLQVQKEIARLIADKSTFAVIYLSMHDFHAINQYYGYDQGNKIIQLLSEIVSHVVRLFGNPEDLAGHFSGDKFVIISTPWKARVLCRRIIADYNRRVKMMFSEEHLRTGHIAFNSTKTNIAQTPVMSIHIAVVTNQKRSFRHHLEVLDYACEQIEYLKRSTDSNCYFDFKINGTEPSSSTINHETTPAKKEDPRIVNNILDWLDFLYQELQYPMLKMKESLVPLTDDMTDSMSREQRNHLRMLYDSYLNLLQVIEVFSNITKPEGIPADNTIDEVDVRRIIDWVLEQVQPSAEEKKISVNVKATGDVFHILADKKSLTQSLLYIIRNEIRSAEPDSTLQINISNMNKNEDNIYVEISNSRHYLSPRALSVLLNGQIDIMRPETIVNELYPASILIRGLGGKLEISSTKGEGIIYRITLPKKWLSSSMDLHNLQSAIDIARNDARKAMKNLHQKITSIADTVPSSLEDEYEKLNGKIRELAILSNRSLFLADDSINQLEKQQDRLLSHESEQLAILEAIIIICRDMVRAIHVTNLFDIESSRRVANYALAIANELKIFKTERRTIYHAALLKDIVFTFSNPREIESMVSSHETFTQLKAQLSHIWKALSSIPFFIPARDLLLYKSENFDGSGGTFGIKGTDIPLGSRILAVADAYESMTSDRAEQGKMTPKEAITRIVENSGLKYDPEIVKAFLIAYKKVFSHYPEHIDKMEI